MPGLCHTSLEGLETERYPQDAFEHGLALAVGFVGRPIDRPLAQQVGIAVCRQAQLGVEGAEALVPRGREGMPPKAHLAKHRIVRGRALLVVGQARPIGASDRLGRTDGCPRDEEQPQQHRTEGQQSPEQGQLHGIRRLCLRAGARDVGQQVLKLVLQLLYNRLWVGSHHRSPLANWWVRLPMIAQGAMAFNSRRSPHAYPYSVPQILVALF